MRTQEWRDKLNEFLDKLEDGIPYHELLGMFYEDGQALANFLNCWCYPWNSYNGVTLDVATEEPYHGGCQHTAESEHYVDGRPVVWDGGFIWQQNKMFYGGSHGPSGFGGYHEIEVLATDRIQLI